MKHRPIKSGLALLFSLALIAVWSGGRTAATAATTFSGQAKVVDATVLGHSITLVDTGQVDAGGGSLEASLLNYPLAPPAPDPLGGALAAEVLHATVVAHGNSSHAEASVASFTLTAAGETISAEFLMAQATAKCNGSTATVAGSAEIVGLQATGVPSITVTGGANQHVPLPVGEIILNEQTTDSGASASSGGITVNALHIKIPGVADVTVASAHADIACGTSESCANKDFITGGGFITTKSGSRANFAVAGGIKNGAFWGHLQYIDHGTPGARAKGTAVTGYTVLGPTRAIDGLEDGSGAAGSGPYHVVVSDGGEPGHGVDHFALTLPGYAQPDVTLDGGNIQLHCK